MTIYEIIRFILAESFIPFIVAMQFSFITCMIGLDDESMNKATIKFAIFIAVLMILGATSYPESKITFVELYQAALTPILYIVIVRISKWLNEYR